MDNYSTLNSRISITRVAYKGEIQSLIYLYTIAGLKLARRNRAGQCFNQRECHLTNIRGYGRNDLSLYEVEMKLFTAISLGNNGAICKKEQEKRTNRRHVQLYICYNYADMIYTVQILLSTSERNGNSHRNNYFQKTFYMNIPNL